MRTRRDAAAEAAAPQATVVIDPAEAVIVGELGSLAVRGGVWSGLGRVLPQIFTIVVSIVAARALGAAWVGRLSFIAFVESTLILVCTLGLPLSLMRYISETLGRGERGELRELMRWGWQLELGGALLGAATLIGIGASGAKPESAWVFAGIACGLAVLHNVPSALLIGTQRWRQATIVGLSSGSLALVAKVGVLAAGHGIATLFLIDAIVALINLVGTSIYARRALAEIGGGATADRGLRKQAIRFAAIQSIGVFVNFIVWRRTELFFLNRYSSNVQIALYTIPFSAVSALLLLPAALSATLTPAIATLFGAGATKRIHSGYARSMRLMLTFALPLTAISMSVGPSLLILVYGPQFRGIRPVLLTLLAAFPVVPLLYTSSALMIGLGRQNVPIAVGAVAAAGNILLDLLLIPRYAAVGAAIANSTAQVLGSLPVIVYGTRIVGGIDWATAALVRTAAASLCAAGAAQLPLWALPPIAGVPLAIFTFAAAFVVLAVRLRILPSQDARWLEAVAGRHLQGRLASAVRLASLPAPAGSGPV